jgi:hypothetical protein
METAAGESFSWQMVSGHTGLAVLNGLAEDDILDRVQEKVKPQGGSKRAAFLITFRARHFSTFLGRLGHSNPLG